MSLLRWTLPLTQTHFQSPQSTSPRGQRACPGTWPESRVAPGAGCARVRHGGRSGAKERAGPARATYISPLRDENVSCPISRTRCSVNFFLGCLKREPDGKGDGNWSQSFVSFSLLAGLGFQLLPEPRYLQHWQAFHSH